MWYKCWWYIDKRCDIYVSDIFITDAIYVLLIIDMSLYRGIRWYSVQCRYCSWSVACVAIPTKWNTYGTCQEGEQSRSLSSVMWQYGWSEPCRRRKSPTIRRSLTMDCSPHFSYWTSTCHFCFSFGNWNHTTMLKAMGLNTQWLTALTSSYTALIQDKHLLKTMFKQLPNTCVRHIIWNIIAT